jgi:hypothetical protein
MFLDAWAVVKVHSQKKIRCYYGKSTKNKPVLHTIPEKQRAVAPTLKETYDCPFEIRYSFLDYHRTDHPDKVPDVFYFVKITHVDFNHSCFLNTEWARQAKQKNGSCQPSLDGMNDILSLLKAKPMLKADVLRPLLLKYVNVYKSIDAVFIRNFRCRAIHFITQNSGKELCMEDARRLISKNIVASDECMDLDDPIVHENFTEILRKVMQEDSGTWDALRYLDLIKGRHPGFDFRIKLDSHGRPEAIMWMFPHQRRNLLRFGHNLFLDGQKRQYNTYGWPYIGPVVKDAEMMVQTCAESICIEESNRIYAWVLKSMSEIESAFELKNVRIIFADQLISDAVLVELGMKETCTLRCDYYHLLQEDWFKYFDAHTYSKVRPCLDKMLLSWTEDEYRNAYLCAMPHVQDNADYATYLMKIYKKPEYYAGYYLRAIEGNLELKGSVPAEQNHASIVAHLGKGANWSVVEHTSQLCNRQAHMARKFRELDNRLHVGVSRYKSDYVGSKKINDELAKKSLSDWAYTKLFVSVCKSAEKLDCHETDEGDYVVWPIGLDSTSPKRTVILKNQRCQCSRRTAFLSQCAHEYAVDGAFVVDKWWDRFYNSHTYDKLVVPSRFAPSLITQNHVGDIEATDLTAESEDGQDGDNTGMLDPEDDSDDEEVDVTLAELRPPESIETDQNMDDSSVDPVRLNYGVVLQMFQELCRAVGNDQKYLASAFSNAELMLSRVRQGQHIDVTFDLDEHDLSIDTDTGRVPNKENIPVRGIACQVHGGAASNMNRMRSYGEVIRKRTVKKASQKARSSRISPSQLYSSNEHQILPPARTSTRTCGLCRKSGHFQKNYPSLLCYKKAPLVLKDKTIRDVLCRDLNNSGKYTTHIRDAGDHRNVVRNFPTGVVGVVIHRRLLISTNLVQPNCAENFCLECTVLKQGGGECEVFTKALFNVPSVGAFITKSKSNIIICEVETSSGMSYVSGDPGSHMVSMSQPGYGNSQQSMTQEMELLNSGTVNFSQDCGMHSMGFETMGYGIGPGDGGC